MADKIAFLNDTSSWYHWGCTATSEAIKEELTGRGYAVTPVPIQAILNCKPVPQSSAQFEDPAFFNQFFKANLAVIAPILKNDMVVINGEGSLHRLSSTSLLLLYLAYASKKFCKKNVQIINHSCYPDGDGVTADSPASMLYGGVYRVLDFVAVREHKTLEVMQVLGVPAALSFDCLPLYLHKHPLTPPPRTRTLVIAGSVAWKAQAMPSLVAYMRAMASEGYTIKVLTGARANPALDDQRFIQALKDAAPDGWEHIDAPSIDKWFETIASAALLISGRFHYTIAACMLGTPCVVLDSNTPKNVALTESAHLPPPLPYTTENLQDALHGRAAAALAAPPVSEEIKKEWVARAKQNFSGCLKR